MESDAERETERGAEEGRGERGSTGADSTSLSILMTLEYRMQHRCLQGDQRQPSISASLVGTGHERELSPSGRSRNTESGFLSLEELTPPTIVLLR